MQSSSGVFPESREAQVAEGELRLFQCMNCSLVQLGESLPQEILFGETYGYRSGLNQSMINHLGDLASYLARKVQLAPETYVVDIGANDGTFLRALLETFPKIKTIAVDPTLSNWENYYDFECMCIPDFFSRKVLPHEALESVGLVTSIAMLYDLPDPTQFMQDIYDSLRPGGYWFTEQSYLPEMIRLNSYDTICHEHLEYYSLTSLQYMFTKVGFKIQDIRFSNSNGGAIGILLQKPPVIDPENYYVKWILKSESHNPMLTDKNFAHFANLVQQQISDLSSLVETLIVNEKARIVGYGASTKGNTILQAANLDSNQILAIEEINPRKFGHFTPKSHIPITDKEEIDSLKPTHKLVLPWHFRESIIAREDHFLKNGGSLIFPLPKIEIIN
jgi:SAM-dependent methyltransferase